MRLVDGVAGETTIFRRRGEPAVQSGHQQRKPVSVCWRRGALCDERRGHLWPQKRLVFAVDVSASMARGNGWDQRLDRMVETVAMVCVYALARSSRTARAPSRRRTVRRCVGDRVLGGLRAQVRVQHCGAQRQRALHQAGGLAQAAAHGRGAPRGGARDVRALAWLRERGQHSRCGQEGGGGGYERGGG